MQHNRKIKLDILIEILKIYQNKKQVNEYMYLVQEYKHIEAKVSAYTRHKN